MELKNRKELKIFVNIDKKLIFKKLNVFPLRAFMFITMLPKYGCVKCATLTCNSCM